MFKSEGSLKKLVYLTIIYWCDQDANDVLSINEEVIEEFKIVATNKENIHEI